MSRSVETTVGAIAGFSLIGIGLRLSSWWLIAAGVVALAITASRCTETS
ncbi:MAG: hypothetical protein ACJAZO_004052 [Myxococcota bacterium]|jgi:hypothetical protein